MGGMLHPTLEGELYGQIAGLNTSEDISVFVMNNGVENIEIPDFYKPPVALPYYIGFGSGYEKGQQLR